MSIIKLISHGQQAFVVLVSVLFSFHFCSFQTHFLTILKIHSITNALPCLSLPLTSGSIDVGQASMWH